MRLIINNLDRTCRNFRRARRLAALGLLLGTAVPASLGAQQSNSAEPIIGPPVISDFELPGNRTTPPIIPPRPSPTPTPAPSPVQVVTPPPPPRATPTPGPARPQPSPTPTPRATPTPAPQPSEPQPVATEAPTPEATPGPVPVPPVAQPAPGAVAPAPQPAEQGLPWLWIALGIAVVGAVGFLAGRKLRPSRAPEETYSPLDEAPLQPAPPVRPAPAAPVVAPTPAPRPRPRLEVAFQPDQFDVTGTEVTIHFTVTVNNAGPAPAEDIHILARMFSASHDQPAEIAAFFDSGPTSATQGMDLPGEHGVRFQSAVHIPLAQARMLTVEGQKIFVPTVAFNVVYRWAGDGRGQTAASYIVGVIGAEGGRLGPFHIDRGPRRYRKIAAREIEFKRAV